MGAAYQRRLQAAPVRQRCGCHLDRCRGDLPARHGPSQGSPSAAGCTDLGEGRARLRRSTGRWSAPNPSLLAREGADPECCSSEDGVTTMPRAINLGSLVTGMTRLREKGSPSPEGLYDLVNGYIDKSGSPVSRSGTPLDYTLPTGTKGGMAFEGKIHVFAASPVTVTN